MAWPDYINVIPYSTLIIFAVNTCIVLLGSLVFRLLINADRLEIQESQVRSHDKNLKEAKRRSDEAALRRLKREEPRIKRIAASVSKQRLKASLIVVIPFTAISLLLSRLYLGKEVVLFPFEFALFTNNYSYSIWYFLTYFTAYLPLSKIFKSSPSLWPNPEVKSKK